jgi:hypothetical protein
MSATTVAKMVYRVKQLTRDPSTTAPRNSLPEVLDALDRAMFIVHSRLPGRASVNAAFISLVANDYDYTLSETDPFSFEAFRLASSGIEVVRVPLADWLRYRTGNPTSVGDPILIAFSPAASGVVTAYVWPTPAEADTIEAVRATMITSVFQGIASTDLTATSLNFGPYGTRAIEYLAASELMNEDNDFAAKAQGLIHEEACWLASYQAGDGVLPSAF